MLTTFGGEGTWSIVTGASSGIGRAYALNLASRGFHCILVARRRDRLVALATHLEKKFKVQTHVVTTDLADLRHDNVTALVTRMIEGGRVRECGEDEILRRDVGLMVCNAGISDVNWSLTDESLSRTEAMVSTNCTSLALLVHAMLPSLEARMMHVQGDLDGGRGGGGEGEGGDGGEGGSKGTTSSVVSAVVTAGALNAAVPLASSSLSSGTKAFVRNFTLAVNETTCVEMICGTILFVLASIHFFSCSIIFE